MFLCGLFFVFCVCFLFLFGREWLNQVSLLVFDGEVPLYKLFGKVFRTQWNVRTWGGDYNSQTRTSVVFHWVHWTSLRDRIFLTGFSQWTFTCGVFHCLWRMFQVLRGTRKRELGWRGGFLFDIADDGVTGEGFPGSGGRHLGINIWKKLIIDFIRFVKVFFDLLFVW